MCDAAHIALQILSALFNKQTTDSFIIVFQNIKGIYIFCYGNIVLLRLSLLHGPYVSNTFKSLSTEQIFRWIDIRRFIWTHHPSWPIKMRIYFKCFSVLFAFAENIQSSKCIYFPQKELVHGNFHWIFCFGFPRRNQESPLYGRLIGL